MQWKSICSVFTFKHLPDTTVQETSQNMQHLLWQGGGKAGSPQMDDPVWKAEPWRAPESE